MKKFIGLVVILAVLVLGSYYAMGYLTERKIKESLITINQSNGIAVSIKEYHRGWLSSTASFDWQFHLPQRIIQANGAAQTIPAKDYQLNMPVTIYHGPLIFSDRGIKFGSGYAHTNLVLPAEYASQFNTLFTAESSQPKLDVDFFVTYIGNSNIEMSVPAFKLFTKEGNAQFDWKGMKTSTTVSSTMDKVTGNFNIDGLRFTKEQVDTTIASITSEYNLHRTLNGLYLGDASLAFPTFVVMNNSEKVLELGQFNLQTDSDIEDGLFSTRFKSSIEKVIAHGQSYGPGNIEVAIRNLDAEVLAKLNTQATQIQQGTALERQKAMLAVLPELPKLFSKGAEFEISEMNFVLPQGTVEGQLMISLPKEDSGNPFQLLQKIQGKGKLKIPAIVVRELMTESIKQKMLAPKPEVAPNSASEATPLSNTTTTSNPALQISTQPQPSPDTSVQAATNSSDITQQATVLANNQLTAMINTGVLVQQGSDYVVEVNLNQGQLTVNGKPFSPAMMKF